jgi:Pyridoxamine 5'-phosphate oxidase
MVTWKDVEEAAPEFADRVRKLFDARKQKTIATLRADGGPRISGIEAEFDGGELTFGSMSGARKGADLHRDPRFALHSPSVDPPEGDAAGWTGDAKIAGRAVPTGPVGGDNDDGGDGDTEGELFRADIDEVVRIGLNDDASALVVEIWTPGGGLRRVERG